VLGVGEQYLDLASPESLPSWSILFISDLRIEREGGKRNLH
jgi:hypothetical protein